ncbi:uncharacterized protein LOC124605181 [Schistocerca americana]|uniref:uncharacterized protein LOC124605181 n=1 Tax=Schistocerca americana TaxID=7009 RepID=UPI001F4FCE2F|nr:uncharacterized protein LOC124605181 [Schistocerca americana]XP_046992652.1 uncharacterized protein LOC124605181 [Schistocerca americana]XP_046992653.1 uncharacterized protein LOC124605181 [Schistocerca americana]XP_046992654.1 uncharacterized protein LOC124605181 [Schistocerca americana]XP_046992655.1 uncharacterized protein LOC124605181 [Schistocerca americana]
MKIFANKFSYATNSKKIKSVQERDNVTCSELAYNKINCDEVSQYSSSDVTTGRISPSQKKIESLHVFRNEEGNVTNRASKSKSLSLGKSRVQTIHKLKELRVVLKRLPELWLRKNQFTVGRIDKLSNQNKYTSRNIAVKPNSCSDVNKSNCTKAQVTDSSDSSSTLDAVLHKGITDSSAVQDAELILFLSKFKTEHPEFLVKKLHVSLHKLSSNLHSYNWSQIENIYQRCKDCHIITVHNSINQENSPNRAAVNKSSTRLESSKKLSILHGSESSYENLNVVVKRKRQRKWHFNCIFCSDDNETAQQNHLSKKCRGLESVKTFSPFALTEIELSENEMDSSDTSYIPAKERKRTVHSKQNIHNKELSRLRRVSPMELINAVKYAMHLALTEPWLQLDVSGPPECCESQHHRMVLHWMKPDISMSDLFRNALSQGVWLPSLLHMMISAGAIPQPEDVQNILLFVMTSEDQIVKENALTIIQMLFDVWPPCCLHTGSYYSSVFRKSHKVGCQESNGLLLSMVAVLHSQLSCKVEMASDLVTYSALVIKIVVSALAADVASWLSRHQTKKSTKTEYEVPLAQIALGQTGDAQIQFSDVKIIVKLCICDRRTTLHHNVFMDLLHLIAEVYRIRYAVPLKEYPGLGTNCHLLASEIVSQMEHCGMKSESIGQFLCVLKPNWLSMLVGQKLLEKLQGPLRGSVIDTVTSYILEYKDFLKREVTCDEQYGKHKVSTKDTNAKKVNKRDCKGEVQLHRSCRRGNVNAVHRILEVPGVDVNICDNAGWTPLHEAVHYSHTACVQALLNFIPSPGSPYVYTAARADCGTTPLISAAIAGDADMCHLLLQHTGIVLLEDVLEGNDIKPQLKEHIPEEIQSLLKTAKLKYENIIERHLGVSLSVEIWTRLHPLLLPLVCSHMATYHVPLVRSQFGQARCGAVQASSTHVEYSTIRQIMRTLRSFEKMRKVINHLCKRHEIPISAVRNFQSYF